MHSVIPPRTTPLVVDTPIILPALLLCDFGHLADEIKKLEPITPMINLITKPMDPQNTSMSKYPYSIIIDCTSN